MFRNYFQTTLSLLSHRKLHIATTHSDLKRPKSWSKQKKNNFFFALLYTAFDKEGIATHIARRAGRCVTCATLDHMCKSQLSRTCARRVVASKYTLS